MLKHLSVRCWTSTIARWKMKLFVMSEAYIQLMSTIDIYLTLQFDFNLMLQNLMFLWGTLESWLFFFIFVPHGLVSWKEDKHIFKKIVVKPPRLPYECMDVCTMSTRSLSNHCLLIALASQIQGPNSLVPLLPNNYSIYHELQ